MQIELCHYEPTADTLWTLHSVVGAAIDLRDTGGSRPPFRRDLKGKSDDRFFKKFSSDSHVDETYQQDNQAEMAALILDENKNYLTGDALFTSDGSKYLARGHLAPDAAFVYDAFQVL